MSDTLNLASVAGFTNLGYRLHSRAFEPVEADLSSKTVVVTGATGGLGLEAARQLAGLGARLILVGRSAEKMGRALDGIEGEATGLLADLSLMTEIRSLADRVRDTCDTVDVLLNNVGVLIPERSETTEGLETAFATNLAGQFLLTNLLIPELAGSAPSRVITVSSGGMYSERIAPDDLNFEQGDYTGTSAYARTKRGQVILTRMWADRLAGSGIVFHAMHPGWAKTAGVAGSLPLFDKVMKPFLRTPAQGADTMVWLAAAQEPATSSGEFWFDRQRVPAHILSKTRETELERELLWRNLVEITGQDLPQLPDLPTRP